jgi:hypothetical protein
VADQYVQLAARSLAAAVSTGQVTTTFNAVRGRVKTVSCITLAQTAVNNAARSLLIADSK